MNKKETLTNKSYIVRYIILKIAMNQYQIDTMIPSENKLAEQLKCARITVHNAYETLKTLGIVKTIKGSGYYVKKSIDAYINQCFFNLYEIVDDIGINEIQKEIDFNDFKIKYVYSFDLIKNKKIIASTYIATKEKIDFSFINKSNINFSKALILAGYNDFFNIQTSINYDNNSFLENFISEPKSDTPVVVTKLFNEKNDNIFLMFTYISKKYFNFTQDLKLIK